ncbi:hypothetical protein CDD83_4261 [Cordyceps sp. RAO-2017]|nr:hypothetical protein CDD83_4261 [Cordyceps sp. RAO-2017]
MSSVTDLPPPVMGNLRHNASEANLRSNLAARGSSTSLALPAAAAAGSGPVRPATPNARPATRNGKAADWVNPLDVHFSRDASASRPGTPAAAAAKTGLLAKFDFGADDAATRAKADEPQQHGANGCPSPPQSDCRSDRSYFAYHPSVGHVSPESRPPSSRCPAPSALRNVNTLAATSLPTPAPPSPPSSSDGQGNGPAPPSEPAARHRAPTLRRPHRPSFTVSFDDPGQRAARRTQHIEGFVGNFADFDFGDSILRPSADIAAGKAVEAAREPTERADSATEPAPDLGGESPPGRLTAPSLAPSRKLPALSLSIGLPSETTGDGARLPADVPTSSVGNHGRGVGLGLAPDPSRGFTSRVDSRSHSTRAPPPQPLRPLQPWAGAEKAKSSPRSPYGPPLEGEGSYVRGPEAETPQRPSGKLPVSPFSRQPMDGDFPVSKGLPRGRLLEPPALPFSSPGSTDDDDEDHAFGRGRFLDGDEDEDEDDEGGLILPSWPAFGNSEHRQSAVPPPLSTSSRSPVRPDASPAASSSAPRLPSPVFSSLITSFSNTSGDLARSFELALEESLNGAGFPALGRGAGLGGSPTRVEARRAPPRPEAPVTVPPSGTDRGGALGARPPLKEIASGAGFI